MPYNDADYVSQILDVFLNAVGTELTNAGRTIDRLVKFSGTPSWDCEMVAVWPALRTAVKGTSTAANPIGAAIKHVADINLLLLRCVTSAEDENPIPPQATVDADGEGYATDMWLVQRALVQAAAGGGILNTGCTEIRFNPVRVFPPAGNLSAFQLTTEVTLT